jgi:hypothetical protein
MDWMNELPKEEGLYLVYDSVNGCIDDDIYEVSYRNDRGWFYGVFRYEKKISFDCIKKDGFLWYGPIPKDPPVYPTKEEVKIINLRPLPVEHPYCTICINFRWELVAWVHHSEITTLKKMPVSCFNRFVPMGRCGMTGRRVSAFATCDSWQDDA